MMTSMAGSLDVLPRLSARARARAAADVAEVDISIVTFHPDLDQLSRLIESLAEPALEPLRRHLFIHDNGGDGNLARSLGAMARTRLDEAFASVVVTVSNENVGFGRGHNANAALGTSPFFLVLNQDCVLEPGVLERLLRSAAVDAGENAAWELRQIPYEHPKVYDPLTFETPWVSGAAVLLRRVAFEAVGGFDANIFMYGEDVDLSWRLRAAGWRLAYRPKLAVVHDTYGHPDEVKPLQVCAGATTNLCLRARYGGAMATLCGLALLAREIAAPQSFPGRRLGLVKAGLAFLARWPYFARTRVKATERFRPHFARWDYEVRRDGAFVPFASRRDPQAAERPLVSILIRTVDRPWALREALASCAAQTYEAIEVVVIEDGPGEARAIVDEFADRLRLRYHATGERMGRARAGNLALAMARGEWLNFLDDDDVLFADHVEVLVAAALQVGCAGAYGLAWETATRTIDRGRGLYEEVRSLTRHRQPFDRLTLWHHNFLPIQAVLFHRRLFERYGGFAEDMEQLEDWNLWTRYTLEDDFVLVEKTTSKYRVPADRDEAEERHRRLEAAYLDALKRQHALRVTLPLPEIAAIAASFARRHRLAARLAAPRPWLARALSRLGVSLE
jgi:GT2 family glycosyltransferase